MNTSFHVPVLPEETLKYLSPKPGEIFVDGTLGGGGHSEEIIKRIIPKGTLIAIDQDEEAIKEGKLRLSKYGERVKIVNDNFVNLRKVLNELNFPGVDGILLDLGVSSHQLDTPERGFSYGDEDVNSPLDMRMNRSQDLKAYDVVNGYPENKLRQIFFEYGEERFGAKIAAEIIRSRGVKKIETTGELIETIRRTLPPKYRFAYAHSRWASKIFRSIRMEVNQELPVLEAVIPQAMDCLKSQGRLVILTFHSLEDRIVKHAFRKYEEEGLASLLTSKPVIASDKELSLNPRAESAKLRAIKKN